MLKVPVNSDPHKAFKKEGISEPNQYLLKAKIQKGTPALVSVIPKSSMTVLHDHHETNVSDGRMSMVAEHDAHKYPILSSNGGVSKQASAREDNRARKIIKQSQIKVDPRKLTNHRNELSSPYGGYDKP
jgi:hypothetical protein